MRHRRRYIGKGSRKQIKVPTSIPADKLRQARVPGRRISRSGRRYVERRSNRSDRNPRRRL
jgi:hypothetical protein